MARAGTFEEQWSDWLKPTKLRYRVRVRPLPLGSWKLRPQGYTFDPCMVFWGMIGFPNAACKGGINQRTFWFAFREPPYLHRDREYHDAEAICVIDEDESREVLIPGLRYQATVDGQTPVAEVEVLGVGV